MRPSPLIYLLAIGLAFLWLEAVVAPVPASAPHHSSYVIYYGWLVEGPDGAPTLAAKRIADARPNILIASYYTESPKLPNLSRQVRALLSAANTRIYAYVTTDYGQRDLDDALAEAAEYLAGGVDGIFFDEIYDFHDDAHNDYYAALHASVKAAGKGVILNPGDTAIGEAIMARADHVMIEHQWRQFYQTNPWRTNYAPDRFMGVSSNEPGAEAYLGYVVDLPIALRDTREAWANGIGWHYSTDSYTVLPVWFLDYARALR